MAIADRDQMEHLCGVPLPGALFECEPFGRRIICLREPPERETRGGIIIPDVAQRMPSVGWVVCAGPDVGTPTPNPNGCPGMSPEQLTAQRVQWGSHVGAAFWVMEEGFEEDESAYRAFIDAYGRPGAEGFRCPFVMLTDIDLWGLVP